MTDNEILPPALLQRKAVVYVRQSTQTQVEANTEGRRRQYELVDVARRRGFRTVEVIDDDLGRSASGMVARPGFEKLVAAARAPARSAQCRASTPRGWPATAGIGTTCWSCAASSRRGLSTSTGYTIPADRTIGSCSA
jgi:hypothetical protein